jgi:hypothetical protein
MQYKFLFALGTRDAVKLVIKKLYKFEVPLGQLENILVVGALHLRSPLKELMSKIPKNSISGLSQSIQMFYLVQKKRKWRFTGGNETGINSEDVS